ncbi:MULTISPECIES: hypothetical protein [unclassified Rhodococcus (in: high G+C Gram-positive bacteria)]|uniref:hypothetical protein n=1 Tax=unclassified Rhodococcus (in: high G+C Gram-positive bacteria) TaxID=192944 RepID=UPI000AA41A40|nr:hypothetical protein [Rhodococcus sp. M8]QPG45743.1 hypothetical protein ISO16_01185 [Rhodococcus sp. M8]
MAAEPGIRVWEPVGTDFIAYGYRVSDANSEPVAVTPPGSPERLFAEVSDILKGGAGPFVQQGDEKFYVHKVEADGPTLRRVHSETAPPFGEWREVTE